MWFLTIYMSVITSRDNIVPWPSSFTSHCPGSTPGPDVVMRGQGDRQPGFTHGARGRGQESKAKGYAGLRCILKRHQLQIPLPAFFVSSITANKIALWSKNPAEHRKSRGRVLHILIPHQRQHISTLTALVTFCGGRLIGGGIFLFTIDRWQRRDEQTITLNITT